MRIIIIFGVEVFGALDFWDVALTVASEAIPMLRVDFRVIIILFF